MALDQSVLLNLLGELRITDVTDLIRDATETLNKELTDAEASAFISAAPLNAPATAPRTATAPGHGPSARPPGTVI